MISEVKLKVENVFGRELIYPACRQSRLLTKFAGKDTFNRDQLLILHRLGVKLTQLDQPKPSLPDFEGLDTYADDDTGGPFPPA